MRNNKSSLPGLSISPLSLKLMICKLLLYLFLFLVHLLSKMTRNGGLYVSHNLKYTSLFSNSPSLLPSLFSSLFMWPAISCPCSRRRISKSTLRKFWGKIPQHYGNFSKNLCCDGTPLSGLPPSPLWRSNDCWSHL